MPNVLFRADAEESIGVGDLMSLIYLSAEFRKHGWQCFFMLRDYQSAVKIAKLRKLQNLFLISCDASLVDEIALIKKICSEQKIDCLFMEVTKHSLGEYRTLGRPSRLKACVNFDGDICDDLDLVVNWCVDSSDKIYKNYMGSNTRFILGFESTILPDYFDWQRIEHRPIQAGVKNILISMGGIDESDLTRRALAALSALGNEYNIRVITGPGYAHYESLCTFAKGRPEITIKHNVDNLLEDYLWADAAVCAGGLTSSELVAAKTPAVLIAACDHQVKRCEYYDKNGWARYAGFHEHLTQDSIMDSIRALIGNIAKYGEKLHNLEFRGGNEEIFKTIGSCR